MTGTQFGTVLRGYAREEVDALVEAVEVARASADPASRLRATDALRSAAFTVTSRGYDRGQVDRYVAQALAEIRA